MEPVGNERRSLNRIVSLFCLLFDQEIGYPVIHADHLDGGIVIHVATNESRQKVFAPLDSVKRGKQVVTVESFGVDGPGSFDDASHGFDKTRFRVLVRIFVIRRVGEASQRGDCIHDSVGPVFRDTLKVIPFVFRGKSIEEAIIVQIFFQYSFSFLRIRCLVINY